MILPCILHDIEFSQVAYTEPIPSPAETLKLLQKLLLIFYSFLVILNKSHKNRNVSLTIHSKYKYFYCTVERAEDRRQKFHFCRLPFAVNVMLNLSKFTGQRKELKTVKANLTATRNQMAGILYQVRHIETLIQGIFYSKLLGKRYDHIIAERNISKNLSVLRYLHWPLSKFANIFHQKMSGTYFSLIYSQSKPKNLVSVPLETVTAADDPQLRNLLVNGKAEKWMCRQSFHRELGSFRTCDQSLNPLTLTAWKHRLRFYSKRPVSHVNER